MRALDESAVKKLCFGVCAEVNVQKVRASSNALRGDRVHRIELLSKSGVVVELFYKSFTIALRISKLCMPTKAFNRRRGQSFTLAATKHMKRREMMSLRTCFGWAVLLMVIGSNTFAKQIKLDVGLAKPTVFVSENGKPENHLRIALTVSS